ncbi:MAG: M50 family metallopeptidase [Gemella sp.]|nr:M50 family metallopeptidase [Gemella sp.]
MEKLKGILIMLLAAALGFGATFTFGYFIGFSSAEDRGFFENTNIVLIIITSFFGILVSINLQTFIHELGHLVFGLLTGYKFSIFRVGSYALKRNHITNKFEIKKQKISGTGGQCLMIPPKKVDGEYPVILYNLGGPIFSLLGGLPLFFIDNVENPYLNLFLLIFGVVGLAYALVNGIPFKSKMLANDGYNAYILYKSEHARESLYRQLVINHEYMQGKRLVQMPDEWFEIPEGLDMKNHLAAAIPIFKENRLFEEMKFNEVRSLINELKTGDYNLVGLYEAMLNIDLATIDLIEKGKQADLSILEDKNAKTIMHAMKDHLNIQILNYALAIIKDEDKEKAEKLKENFIKSIQKSVYPAELEIGLELMEKVDKSIELQEEPSI